MKTAIIVAIAAASSLALAAPAPAFAQDGGSFSGPRAEVFGGYDGIKTNSNGQGAPDGFLYGFGLGYDVNLGGAVLGLDGEIADSTGSHSYTTGNIDADRDLYIGARAGIPVTDKLLAYVKAGYTNARLKTDGVGANYDGVRVGSGLEYRLGGNVYAKAEYRYSNYAHDYERHQVLGGIGIRF